MTKEPHPMAAPTDKAKAPRTETDFIEGLFEPQFSISGSHYNVGLVIR